MHGSIKMVNLNVETQRVAYNSLENSNKIQGSTFHDLNNKLTISLSQKRRHTIKRK